MLVILPVVAVGRAAAGVMIWQGCVLALRGRGDRTALVIWLAIAGLEVVLSSTAFVLLLGLALVAQMALYFRGRATPPPPGGGRAPPTRRSRP